jgi:hypothetical protein
MTAEEKKKTLAILVAPILGAMSGLDSMECGYVPEKMEVRDAVHCAAEALRLIEIAAMGGSF